MHSETKLQVPGETPYEAPEIERVIAPDEVEREVHYAGEITPVR